MSPTHEEVEQLTSRREFYDKAVKAGSQYQAERDASGDGMAQMGTILVVDDEPLICKLIADYLSLRGYAVRTATSGKKALAMVAERAPDLIVLDVYMPEMLGADVLEALKKQRYKGAVIILTASRDQKLLQDMLKEGVVDVMCKPVNLAQLAMAIQVGFTLHDL